MTAKKGYFEGLVDLLEEAREETLDVFEDVKATAGALVYHKLRFVIGRIAVVQTLLALKARMETEQEAAKGGGENGKE